MPSAKQCQHLGSSFLFGPWLLEAGPYYPTTAQGDRSVLVPYESRITTVPAEERVVLVPYENRIVTVERF